MKVWRRIAQLRWKDSSAIVNFLVELGVCLDEYLGVEIKEKLDNQKKPRLRTF